MTTLMPSLNNITWDRLVEESAVTYPAMRRITPAMISSLPMVFRPRAERASLFPASLIPPDETPDEDYPLVLTTGRQLSIGIPDR